MIGGTVVASTGFMTGRSSMGADISLLVAVIAVALLTVGVVLVRRRHFTAHRWVQTLAVILSAVVAVAWMAVSFVRYILPGLPGSLAEHGHVLAAVHGAIGAAAFALGMVLVVRGNQLMAQRRSLRRYRTPMRVAYLLYVAAVVAGVTLYVVTYG